MTPVILLSAALVLAPIIGGGYGELTNGIVQIIVFAAVCAYALLGRRDARRWPVVPGAIALGVFVGATLTSVFFSECVYASLKQLLFVLTCVAAFYLASSVAGDTRKAAMLISGLVASALWICSTTISEYASSTGGGAKFWAALMSSGDHWRLFGTFANPNFFAGFLVMILPVSLAMYLVARKGSLALLFGMAFAMELAALAMTGSKSGAISATAALMVFLLLAVFTRCLGKQQFVRLLVVMVLIAPMVVAFSGTTRARVQAAQAGGAESHSSAHRMLTWKGTVRMIETHPWVGVGPGAFDIAFPRYALAGFTSHAHESYLQTAAESGVVALAGLIGLLMAIGWAGVKSVGKPGEDVKDTPTSSEALTWDDVIPPSSWRAVACGLLGALAGSVASNLVNSDWYVIGIALPFWILAGMLVSRSAAAERRFEIIGWWKTWLVGACVACVGLSLSFGLGDLHASKGAEFAGHGAWSDAQREYELAAQISPLNPAYQRELSKFMDVDAAIKQLDKAIRLAPMDGEGYWLRGAIARNGGRMDLALKSFNKALALKPHSTQILYDRAMTYREMGRTDDYESTLRDLLAMEQTNYEKVTGTPENVDTRYVWAHVYFGEKYLQLKKYNEAIAQYEAAANRLERWRSYPDYIKIAIMSGRLTQPEKQKLLQTLQDSYFKSSEAYKALGNEKKSTQARKNGEGVVIE